MKKLMTIFLLTILPPHLKADGPDWYMLKAYVETTKGQKFFAYLSISTIVFQPDSFSDKKYMQDFMDRHYRSSVKDISYYRSQIIYKYSLSDFKSKAEVKKEIRHFFDMADLNTAEISSIHADTIYRHSWYSTISGDVKLSDSIWMKKKPLKRMAASGYLCSHSLFVHENSAKVDSVFKELKAKQEEYDRLSKKEFQDDEQQARDRHYERLNNIDEEFGLILRKLKGEKVVVVSYCTD